MNQSYSTAKRIGLYVVGLFFLSLGVSFSIEADLGVSPVSSLPYAFALISSLSVGTMTVIANVLFIIFSVILSKQFNFREAIGQLIVAFLFGFFIDATSFLVQQLPSPDTLAMRWVFMIVSLFGVAIGLFGYMGARFFLLPYDYLTYVISERFNMKFSKAKISSDLLNVGLAGLICVIFIQSLGSVGIGTIVAAYLVGKILGWIRHRYQAQLEQWLRNESITYATVKEERSSLT